MICKTRGQYFGALALSLVLGFALSFATPLIGFLGLSVLAIGALCILGRKRLASFMPRLLGLRSVASVLVLATLAMTLPGCALFAPEIDKAAKGAGKLVTFYCENVTSADVRQQLRDKVNAYAQPNSVRVECASDKPPLQVGRVEREVF